MNSKLFSVIGGWGGLSTVVVAAVSVFVGTCAKLVDSRGRKDMEAPEVELTTRENPMLSTKPPPKEVA